jgi:hypothetical protein
MKTLNLSKGIPEGEKIPEARDFLKRVATNVLTVTLT